MAAVYRSPLLLAALAVLAFAPHASGQVADPPAPPARQAPARETPAPTPPPGRLPPEVVTQHSLELPGRTLAFSTAAGAIRATDARGQPIADIAYVAYALGGADHRTRPVTFVFNGGPGMAAGWLQAGAVGPWIVPLGADVDGHPSAIPASAPAAPGPNADTWLDFTDLVFIDPAGTGYSRAIVTGDEGRRDLYSVEGDISYLAQVMRRWLDQANRTVSPKFILGESYGGFRAPQLARALQHDQGVGVSGVIMLSPALDFGGRSAVLDPLYYAIRLPSMAAAARAEKGAVTRADLTDAEQYAAGDYVVDLLRGVRDADAVARASQHVSALTGLPLPLVQRYQGRIDTDVFLHDMARASHVVGSPYDPTITVPDPFPLEPYSDYDERVVAALASPITGAMVALYADELHWHPDGIYRLASDSIFHAWQWDRRMSGGAQSVSALRLVMSLDPSVRVLIGHGMFDLVTPYFGTELILRQIPDLGASNRIELAVYPGGHMFYTQPSSRAAFREQARRLIRGD
jgi:carboxypeptidase C (cathepsin A)